MKAAFLFFCKNLWVSISFIRFSRLKSTLVPMCSSRSGSEASSAFITITDFWWSKKGNMSSLAIIEHYWPNIFGKQEADLIKWNLENKLRVFIWISMRTSSNHWGERAEWMIWMSWWLPQRESSRNWATSESYCRSNSARPSKGLSLPCAIRLLTMNVHY